MLSLKKKIFSLLSGFKIRIKIYVPNLLPSCDYSLRCTMPFCSLISHVFTWLLSTSHLSCRVFARWLTQSDGQLGAGSVSCASLGSWCRWGQRWCFPPFSSRAHHTCHTVSHTVTSHMYAFHLQRDIYIKPLLNIMYIIYYIKYMWSLLYIPHIIL